MSDSTGSGDVVDECAAGAAELVVEGDAGGEGEEALEDAVSDAEQGAGAVAFEREQLFAGPEDRLDSLPDRRELRARSGFVSAAGPDDGGVEFGAGLRALAAGVTLVGDLEEAAVAGDPHDRVRDAERDDLRVCDDPTGVPCRFRQEIVRRAIDGDAEGVEVGVHRDLLVDGVLSTADFDPSAQSPSNTATAVESLI